MVPEPGSDGKDFIEDINSESLKIKKGFAEASLKEAKHGSRYQFQRKGYFVVDKDSVAGNIVFNKIVGLRDSWKKDA